jgi:ribonuclease HII
VFLGVTDSKALTESKRESMFEQMSSLETSAITYVYRALSAQLISACMLVSHFVLHNSYLQLFKRRIKCSLNELSYRSAIDLIQAALDAQINIGHVCHNDTSSPIL